MRPREGTTTDHTPTPARSTLEVEQPGVLRGREVPASIRFLGRAFATLWDNTKARIGLIVLFSLIAIAIFAPLIAQQSPSANNFVPYQNPNSVNWFGTTGNGQDVFAQLVYGTRVSLLVSFVAGAIATVLALLVGLVAGFRPGIVDETLMYITNQYMILPGLVLIIVVSTYVQSESIWITIIFIGLTGWPTGAKVMRSQAATLRTSDFVSAAVLSGERLLRVAFREILPNMTSLAAASFFGAAGAALGASVGLEFLGIGNPNTVAWGNLLYWAEQDNALLSKQILLLLAPGVAIAILAVSFAFINFGIDALSNPRLRER